VTWQGSADARIRRALATGNPLLVRAAAAELGTISLADALSICLVPLRGRADSLSPSRSPLPGAAGAGHRARGASGRADRPGRFAGAARPRSRRRRRGAGGALRGA